MSKISRLIILFCAIGFPLNFIWEYFHFPLYYSHIALSHPFLAFFSSTLDVAAILFIYFLLSILYKNNFWLLHWDFKKVFAVIICGLLITLVSEKIALATGLWNYKNSMPMVPIIHIGLSPVLQLVITPLVTLYLSSKITKKLTV